VNTGYNVRAEWFTFDVDIEDFTKPRRGGPKIDDGSSGESTPAGIDPSSLRGVQGPRADRKIVLPGTDGELVEMELPLLAAGNLVAQPINKGGVSLLALALAGVGAVVVGLGTVTVIRRRRLARTTA
jgi:hypothetical protein